MDVMRLLRKTLYNIYLIIQPNLLYRSYTAILDSYQKIFWRLAVSHAVLPGNWHVTALLNCGTVNLLTEMTNYICSLSIFEQQLITRFL